MSTVVTAHGATFRHSTPAPPPTIYCASYRLTSSTNERNAKVRAPWETTKDSTALLPPAETTPPSLPSLSPLFSAHTKLGIYSLLLHVKSLYFQLEPIGWFSHILSPHGKDYGASVIKSNRNTDTG